MRVHAGRGIQADGPAAPAYSMGPCSVQVMA